MRNINIYFSLSERVLVQARFQYAAEGAKLFCVSQSAEGPEPRLFVNVNSKHSVTTINYSLIKAGWQNSTSLSLLLSDLHMAPFLSHYPSDPQRAE